MSDNCIAAWIGKSFDAPCGTNPCAAAAVSRAYPNSSNLAGSGEPSGHSMRTYFAPGALVIHAPSDETNEIRRRQSRAHCLTQMRCPPSHKCRDGGPPAGRRHRQLGLGRRRKLDGQTARELHAASCLVICSPPLASQIAGVGAAAMQRLDLEHSALNVGHIQRV